MCVASSTNGKSASAACGSGTRIDGFEGPVLARSGAPDQGRQDSLGSGLCIWTWRRLGEGFSVWTCACVQLGFGNTGTRGEARSTKAESHLDGVNYAGGGCEVGTYVLPEGNTFRRRRVVDLASQQSRPHLGLIRTYLQPTPLGPSFPLSGTFEMSG